MVPSFVLVIKKIYIIFQSLEERKKCFRWLWKRQVQSCIIMVTLFLLWNSRIWLLGHWKITLKGITYSMLPTKLRFIKFPLLSHYIKDLCWSNGTDFGQFGGGVYYPNVIYIQHPIIHSCSPLLCWSIFCFFFIYFSFYLEVLSIILCSVNLIQSLFYASVFPILFFSVCTLFDKYNWALNLKKNSSTQIYFLHFKYFFPQHKYISFISSTSNVR